MRRSIARVVIALGGASALLASAAPSLAQDPRVTLTVTAAEPRIELRLAAMPPSRTWCRIENENGTQGTTVLWDPVMPDGLVRAFTAPSRGDYTLGCWSEAIRPTVRPDLNFGYSWVSRAATKACPSTYDAVMDAQVDRAGAAAPQAAGALELRCVAKPTVGAPLSPAVALAPQSVVSGASLRSFGAVNESMVQEVFAVLAETIVEQAEERGTQVLESRLQELVCDPQLALPSTCEAVRTVRLADLAASGKQLQEALAVDFVRRALPALKALGGGGSTSLEPVLTGGISAALELSRGRAERARDAARPLLLQLLAKPLGNDEEVVFAAIRDCMASKGCDPVAIRERLERPSSYFGGGAVVPVDWQGATRFVNAATAVLAPPVNTTEAQQLRSLLHMTLDLVERRTPAASKSSLEAVAAARQLTDGLLERDAGVVATASIRLFSTTTTDERLQKLARLATALTSFTSTTTAGREPTEDERAARRTARKEALKSLIAEYGSRKHRLGDTVLSLGGGAYVSGSAAFGFQGGDPAFQAVPLSVPVGLGLDVHSQSGWGFHGLLAPIDLGAYATIRTTSVSDEEDDDGGVVPPGPGDALRPAVFVGLSKLIADADLVLVGGATVGMAPKVGLGDLDDGADQGAFYLGLVAGAYIPLIDFN